MAVLKYTVDGAAWQGVAPGPAGPEGPRGATGAKGDTGAQGPAGPTEVVVTRPNGDDVLVKAGGQTVWYDSGIRDVTSLSSGAGFTAIKATLTRRGGFVDLVLAVNLTGAAMPAGPILTLPTGFRPRDQAGGYGDRLAFQADGRYIVVALIRGGAVTLYAPYATPVIPEPYRLTAAYACEDTLPPSLPGTLVSAAAP